MAVTPEQVERWLSEDLAFFNKHANIVVMDKGGDLVPFEFNLAQRYIHDKLEEQRKLRGWVRACLLKGRQQGGSTYIEDRFFHKIVRGIARRAFILSHESKTTDNLFAMVRRFYENMRPEMRPSLDVDNPRQMGFKALDATYSAGTAGNEQAGRGTTSQLFHGSEAAYWKAAYAILDGALQSIALLIGTEIILESTANGPVGLFYDICKQAMAGIGDFILIFVPWFWQEEYERDPLTLPNFTGLDEEEEKFIATYFSKPFPYHTKPISREKALRKMAWRRGKIIEMTGNNNPEGGKAKFRAIYPANPIEAFLSTSVGIIRPDAITTARANYATADISEFAPRLLGVDPAGAGKKADRTILSVRQGRRLDKVIKYPKMTPMRLAGIIVKLIEEEDLDHVFIDRGYGEGTIDRLHELGFGGKVTGVAFNETPLSELYANKRAEIIIETAKWLNDGIGIAIPDAPEKALGNNPDAGALCGGDEIHADLAAMPLDKERSDGVKSIVAKEQIVADFGRSPDIYDSIALTFSYPVRRKGADDGGSRWKRVEKASGRGPLGSLNRRRAMR